MIRRMAITLGLGAVLCCAAFAYEYPLSSTAIREAYFLGRSSGERLTDFLAQYTRNLPLPKNGPYIETIELDTPYAGVVQRARSTPNYYTPDAVEEFLGKPGIFRARVSIYLTPTYSRLTTSRNGEPQSLSPDFWRDFKIELSQAGKSVEPDSIEGEPIYGAWNELVGAGVELDYRAEKIASASAVITVTPPEGAKAEADFDLARLK